VNEYEKINSCTSVHQTFRKRFSKDPPPRALMPRWFEEKQAIAIAEKRLCDR
jgi:hypothetical protein